MECENNGWGGKRDNSGRPSIFKGEEKQKVTLYLTPMAYIKLSDLAKDLGISKSDMAIKLILNE